VHNVTSWAGPARPPLAGKNTAISKRRLPLFVDNAKEAKGGRVKGAAGGAGQQSSKTQQAAQATAQQQQQQEA